MTGTLIKKAVDHQQTTRVQDEINRTSRVAVLALLFGALLPMVAICAQSVTSQGSLSGSILDPTGARVPRATVYLRETDGSIVAIDHANGNGDYSFRGVLSGRYEVEAISPGFAALRSDVIPISSGTSARADLTLEIGDALESVTVIGVEPSSAAPSPAQRIRVGGNVQAAKLISKVNPIYPPDAAAADVEGTVTMRAVISTAGNLLSVTSINNGVDPRLERAAEDAVRNWQYKPTQLNGDPVEVTTIISIVFRLNPDRQ